ncbi:hypothetical protein NC653_025244 [Populus alba x Populus x berolinensis]|uniref:Cyclin-D1-binding protein 1-like N-terminal domain-containing protein n=1 Tax=Populus alba x Populus x berolinensis TaxID=444605 RepID=A0AAD6MAR0_9ROSI|nr:hypothetical protein NC653_025244 [Populus alba x Populus x berolinensis]
MGKAERERLNQSLSGHLNTIHETLQLLDQTPASSLDKLTWDVGVKMGDQEVKPDIEICKWILMLRISSFPIIYSLAGSRNKDLKPLVPQLVGAVWEACTALKKTPASNITAIGRAMTKVAVSVKDALPEMEELKPVSSNQTEEASDDDASHAET